MTTTTTVRSWSAIVAGVLFSAVTSFVLTEDVFRHGAPLTTKHVMTLAVLAGTIYFGHALWRELRAWRLGTAFGCTVLFLAGTTTCVLMSAGRNAEVVTTKALAANSVNTARASAQKDRDEAKLRYQAALQAEEYQCSTGNGPKCSANRITRMVRREEYDAAEATLRDQKPEQIANADVVAASKLVARLPFVTADAGAIEALLLLVQPFLLSLFCEVGAIVGFSMAVGHKSREALPEAPEAPEPDLEPEPSSASVPSVPLAAETNGTDKTDETEPPSPAPVSFSAKDVAERDLVAYIGQTASNPPHPSPPPGGPADGPSRVGAGGGGGGGLLPRGGGGEIEGGEGRGEGGGAPPPPPPPAAPPAQKQGGGGGGGGFSPGGVGGVFSGGGGKHGCITQAAFAYVATVCFPYFAKTMLRASAITFCWLMPSSCAISLICLSAIESCQVVKLFRVRLLGGMG